jgi:hypothetical protein
MPGTKTMPGRSPGMPSLAKMKDFVARSTTAAKTAMATKVNQPREWGMKPVAW